MQTREERSSTFHQGGYKIPSGSRVLFGFAGILTQVEQGILILETPKSKQLQSRYIQRSCWIIPKVKLASLQVSIVASKRILSSPHVITSDDNIHIKGAILR